MAVPVLQAHDFRQEGVEERRRSLPARGAEDKAESEAGRFGVEAGRESLPTFEALLLAAERQGVPEAIERAPSEELLPAPLKYWRGRSSVC